MTTRLTAEQRTKLDQLFNEVVDLPTAQHAAYIGEHCQDDDAVRAALARLLAGHAGEDHLAQLQPPLPIERGTKVGVYTIEECIGEGGMGEVYAANQREPVTRKVALKVVKRGMDSAQVVHRFGAERQALARMTHANVAQVYDGGVTADGRPFFAMEYVDGLPLTEHCSRHEQTINARLGLFLDVCAGVQHAHLKGIIHRDLKPSNLLVTKQNERTTVKVIDFGIARAVTGRLSDRTLHTMAGQVVGTLDYMSPEQADPTALDIDTRSDVYSLGVVLYQLLTGELPFDHASNTGVPLSEIQRIIRDVEPPTPSARLRETTNSGRDNAVRVRTDANTLIRQVTGDLDWICLKALAKGPADRYQSVAELAADVQRHLGNQPVLAHRPSSLYRLRKFTRRNRTLVAAGSIAIASLIAGAVGIISGRIEAETIAKSMLGLSDNRQFDQLDDQSNELWPAHPTMVPAIDGWLTEAHDLTEHLSLHRANLANMRAANANPNAKEQWLRDELVALIDKLTDLDARLHGEARFNGDHGWTMQHRLTDAERLAVGFAPGGKWHTIWADNLPAIRTHYNLPKLTMQMGLVPIGFDLETGWWEFAHLSSGTPATRDADGKILMTDTTGIVLVLLPGDEFKMGAQSGDEEKDNYHKRATWLEKPVWTATVDAFFMSKFEMTQSQWQFIQGKNPSHTEDDMDLDHVSTNPVNTVSWHDCNTTASRMGLTLPTEQEWEYAARAGTTTPWWQGATAADVVKSANLRDDADGYITITKVGQFPANGFGLHDVTGNVSEWCSNHPWAYRTQPGSDPATLRQQVARGGSSRSGAFMARSSFRHTGDPYLTGSAFGLRPARAITNVNQN